MYVYIFSCAEERSTCFSVYFRIFLQRPALRASSGFVIGPPKKGATDDVLFDKEASSKSLCIGDLFVDPSKRLKSKKARAPRASGFSRSMGVQTAHGLHLGGMEARTEQNRTLSAV